MPITANMNTMIQRTNVKLDRAPTVFAMIVKMSFNDFHDLANLKTRRRRNERNMDKPFTPSKVSSTIDSTTIKKSKQFQPSEKKYRGLIAASLMNDSKAKIAVK